MHLELQQVADCQLDIIETSIWMSEDMAFIDWEMLSICNCASQNPLLALLEAGVVEISSTTDDGMLLPSSISSTPNTVSKILSMKEPSQIHSHNSTMSTYCV